MDLLINSGERAGTLPFSFDGIDFVFARILWSSPFLQADIRELYIFRFLREVIAQEPASFFSYAPDSAIKSLVLLSMNEGRICFFFFLDRQGRETRLSAPFFFLGLLRRLSADLFFPFLFKTGTNSVPASSRPPLPLRFRSGRRLAIDPLSAPRSTMGSSVLFFNQRTLSFL